MKNFKRNIYRLSEPECEITGTAVERAAEVIVLDPFDYMIVTYQYDNSLGSRDLDSATAFYNTGTVEDAKWVGCGQSRYITPTNSNTINNAYLFQAGDDVSNGLGESIVINFKNLELAGISVNNDVRVELYAGWCVAPIPMVTNVSATTYIGGTMSISANVITSNGTVKDSFTSNDVPARMGCCGASPLTGKTHIGTIYFNLVTKVSSVVFY